MSDERAVLVEPLAVRDPRGAARGRARRRLGARRGAGTVGILTLLALRRAREARPRDRRRQAPAAARGREAGRRRRGRASRARREGGARAEHAMKLTPERGQDFLLGGVDVAIECVGLEGRARPRAAHHEGRRAGRAVRHPRRRRRPHAGVVPRARARRRLHRRHRDGRRRAPPHVRPRASRSRRGRADARARWWAPRIRWPAGARRSTTRSAPAGSARSRWRSRPRRPRTGERRADAQTRIRAGGRRTDARRCSSTRARGSACSGSRSGTRVVYPPDPLPGIRDVNARDPARAAASRGRREAAARAADARHEAHDRDRRHLDPAAADDDARHPPADHRARDRAGGAARASRT